jgi:hypothetical protein
MSVLKSGYKCLISYPCRHGYGPYRAIKPFGLCEGFSFYVWTSQADVLLSRDYLNQYC